MTIQVATQLEIGLCVTNSYRDSLFWRGLVRFSCGKLVRGSPMRKCDGVSGCKSLGSVDSGVKGRELRIDSIWLRQVFISS
jgi:hypothetical protein